MSKPRVVKIHWWRARNVWSVVFSDHCEHYDELSISVPLRTVLSDKAPRAYLKGKATVISHGKWAEVV